MSNCIQLYHTRQATDKVVFFRDEIDVEGFKAFLARAERSRSDDPPVEEREREMAWWFLQANTLVDHRGAVIRFGQGRSSHTWRDLRGTVDILKRFVKKTKYHRFVATDEADGHRKAFWLDIEFHRGAVDGQTSQEYHDALDKRIAALPPIDLTKITVRTLTKDGWVETRGDQPLPGL